MRPNWELPKIFHPFRNKVSAGFIGKPLDFSQKQSTIDFFKKYFPEKNIFTPCQIHGKKVFNTDFFCSGQESDGVFTTKKYALCTVKTADCIGALFYSPEKNMVAAIHAGWRGLSQKIFSEFFKQISGGGESFFVALSPSLGPCCAEFSDPYNETPDFFHPFITEKDGRYFIDLWGVAEQELLENNIKKENIQMPSQCSKCGTEESFWSHRNKDLQRNISFIALK